MKNSWQLQEAKNKLSQVLDWAQEKGPQFITRHGGEEAVILSVKDYKKLKKPSSTITTFFKISPLVGADLDLERSDEYSRDVDL